MSILKNLLSGFLFISSVSVPALVLAHGNADHHSASEQTEFGQPGKAAEASRTIEITMGDNMRFVPDHIAVQQGETVRLRLVNTGNSAHEFVLGTAEEIAEHAELMKKFPTMEHSDPSSARAEAGQQKEIIWQFNRAGNFVFACLIPGHSEAGMRGTIKVTASTSTAVSADDQVEPIEHPVAQAENVADLSEGEIIKVDTAQAKLTIKHGELKNLKMPGMTMIFRLKNPELASQYKAGDRIRFKAEIINGALTVTRIELETVINEAK